MIWLKYPLIFLLFFISAIIQSSFLFYLNIMESTPNLIFILFFIIIFFESQNEYNLGFFTAIIAGLFLDIHFSFYFGISIISLLIIYFLKKIAAHFFEEGNKKFSLFYFIPLFLISFLLYGAIMYLFSLLLKSQSHFIFDSNALFYVLYNLIVAIVGFYPYRRFIKDNVDENQLKLL